MHTYASSILSFSLTCPLWRRSTRRSLRFYARRYSRVFAGRPPDWVQVAYVHSTGHSRVGRIHLLVTVFDVVASIYKLHAGPNITTIRNRPGSDLNVATVILGSKEETTVLMAVGLMRTPG